MKKLSKKTLNRCWWRWMFGNLASTSYQWLESFGFADAMSPAIKELYKDDKEEQIAALKRHSVFYNTEPQIGTVVNGIACGMEEERANGAELDDEVINGIKIGLMGPLAGIGDSMVPGMYIPLLLSIGISLASGGNVLGPLFYIVVYMATMLVFSHFLFMKGYQLGTKSINIIVGESAQKIREAFNYLGGIIVGGVAASYVSVNCAWIFSSGQSSIKVNDVLNNIFPKVLPLVIVVLCWWLMAKKNLSALKVMGVLIVLAIIGTAVHFF